MQHTYINQTKSKNSARGCFGSNYVTLRGKAKIIQRSYRWQLVILTWLPLDSFWFEGYCCVRLCAAIGYACRLKH